MLAARQVCQTRQLVGAGHALAHRAVVAEACLPHPAHGSNTSALPRLTAFASSHSLIYQISWHYTGHTLTQNSTGQCSCVPPAAHRLRASSISPGDRSTPMTLGMPASIHFQMSPPRPQAKSSSESTPVANLWGGVG